MADGNEMEQIVGDFDAFFTHQAARLTQLGIDVTPYPVGHLAFRTGTYDEYLAVRTRLEALAEANVENRWNGRAISKLLLREPRRLGDHHDVSLIELIPPPHQRNYPMGLEHLGLVLGPEFEAFAVRHRGVITEQQDQGPFNQPLLITFDDGTSVKFHQHSLHDVVVMEGQRFDGFHHAR